MNLWACTEADTILNGIKNPDWWDMIKACRFKGFFVIAFDVSRNIDLSAIAKVKHILDEEGYEMIGCGIPLGHPEGLDTPCYTFHDGWHIRKDINGETVRWCNAITPQLISDVRNYVCELRELGIRKIFWDDDLRQGNCEGDIQGCFCDECVNEFAEKNSAVLPAEFNREILRAVIKRVPVGLSSEQLKLRELWTQFNCERVTRFMRETTVDGVQNGIMVMHNGDRRHGIDIAEIRKAVPDCMFRVGEGMFDDYWFNSPENRHSLAESVLRHMKLMGDVSRIYSESTVFPHGALTPENLRRKIIIERKCGLENINLMGLERMNSEHYYYMLRDNYDYFEAVEKELTLDNIDSFDFVNI